LDPQVKGFDPWVKDFDPQVKDFDPQVKDLDPWVKDLDPQVKGFDPWVNDFDPRVKDCDPRVKDLDPKVKDFDPWVKDLDPWVKDCDPWVKGFEPQVKDLDPWVEMRDPSWHAPARVSQGSARNNGPMHRAGSGSFHRGKLEEPAASEETRMTAKPRFLSLLVLLGALMIPALASSQGRPHGGGPGGPGGPGPGGGGGGAITDARFLTRYLSLTAAQVTQLKTFLATLQTAEQAVRTSHTALCQQLRTDIDASTPDPATVGKDYLALVDSQSGIRTAITAFEASLSAVLTADQLTKFQTLIQTDDSTDALPGCPPTSAAST
jgi:Spy/CpxP family protein refolding chaperone